MALGLVLASGAVAKDKLMNIQGRVQVFNKEASTFTVENGSIKRDVMYSGDTKFLYGHSKKAKAGAADQVKEGYFMSCAGEPNGSKWMAKECVYRESK
jgi:hypothetical protein